MKITKRKDDGRYQCTLYLGTDPITGKKKQKTVSAKSRAECKQKALKILEDTDAAFSLGGDRTLGSWVDTWLSDYTRHYKPSTLRAAQGHVRNHIGPFFGSYIRLRDIDAVLCQQFVNTLNDKPISPKTVKNVHETLHVILGSAVRAGLIKANPAERLIMPKQTKPELHPLDEEELAHFLDILDDDVTGAILRFLSLTGLRVSECLGLTWDRIDGSVMMIDRQLYKDQFIPTKSGKPRQVPLPRPALDILKRRRAQSVLSLFVFADDKGRAIRYPALARRFRIIRDRAGFPALRIHDLRHTYATIAIRAGVDYKSLSESLGHYSTAYTMDTYAFVSRKMQEEQASRIAEFWDSII